MIVRQLCARHGRTVLAQSSRSLSRTYATAFNPEEPVPSRRPSERDPRGPPRIPGHPDDPSSILDSIDRAPSPMTRRLEELLNSHQESLQSLRADVHAHAAARITALSEPETAKGTTSAVTPPPSTSATTAPPKVDPFPFESLGALNRYRQANRKQTRQGTHLTQTYNPMTILKNPPTADDLTLPMLLANQTHLGHATSLWNPANSGYIFGIRDGIHIISLDITYAYLKRAAKVVEAVARRGGIILFVGTRSGMEDVTVNSAKLAEGYHIFHRWVPGTLTNGQQILGTCAVKVVDMQDKELTSYADSLGKGFHQVMRPDLVICLNPIENEVCLHECGFFNVPTIGVIDTDANPTWVTYPIPANDDSFRSLALIGGVLGNAAKEGQKYRKAQAKKGKLTYDTGSVEQRLGHLEELLALDVQAADTQGKADAD